MACIDAIVRSYIAIVSLQAGDVAHLPMALAIPIASPTTPSTTPPADTEDSLLQTTNGEMAAFYDADSTSRTTSDVSDEYSSSTDHRPHTVSWIMPGNDIGRDLLPYAVIGPLVYMHFSKEADSTSDAGFAVDLLFEHRLYRKVSLWLWR